MKFKDIFSFKPKLRDLPDTSIFVDFHSHILPGIDDGAKTIENSIELIRELQFQGIKKIITTPHIIGDLYPNNHQTIETALHILKEKLIEENIDIEIHATAEYYIDEYFLKLRERGEELRVFGNKNILVETNYVEKPEYLGQTVFDLQIDGYTVIFAHPERYHYLIGNWGKLENLYDTGMKFQVNLISFTGGYSPQIKETADFLAKHKMIYCLGSDVHHMDHARLITHFKRTERYQELLELPLKNNTLID